MDVAIGVDSHKQTLEAAALDHVGKPFAARRFANDPKGHRALLRWVEGMQGELVVRIPERMDDCLGSLLSTTCGVDVSRSDVARRDSELEAERAVNGIAISRDRPIHPK
jgi:hypothetical protein